MFMTNQWEIVEISSAQKKEEKTAERARDIIANPFCYSPGRASHCMGPPFIYTPHPAEKAGPHPSEKGRGLEPRFQVKGRERRGRRRRMGWWERRERGTETDPASHIVTCDLSHYHLVYHLVYYLVYYLALGHNAWSPTPALLALCNVRSTTPPLRTDLEPRVSAYHFNPNLPLSFNRRYRGVWNHYPQPDCLDHRTNRVDRFDDWNNEVCTYLSLVLPSEHRMYL